jgi:hypothetical protein
MHTTGANRLRPRLLPADLRKFILFPPVRFGPFGTVEYESACVAGGWMLIGGLAIATS